MGRVIAGIVVFSLIIGFSGNVCAAEKPITLEFTSVIPPQNKIVGALIDWCKAIETRTKGRVKINYHPMGTLVPPAQTFDAVAKGVVDIGWASLGYNLGKYPLSEVLDLPLGIRSALEGAQMANAYFAKFKPKELDDVHILWSSPSPPAYYQTKKPVKTLEDMKGLKVRCSGGGGVAVVKALGGVPVALQVADTYDAISKGIVGGALFASEALESFKWKDVAKYTTINVRSAINTNGIVAMNKKKYQALPADIKKIFDEESRNAIENVARVWDEMDRSTVANAKKQGHTFIELSKDEEEKWFQKVRPLFDQYVKEKSAKGLPAAEALEFCRSWLAKNRK